MSDPQISVSVGQASPAQLRPRDAIEQASALTGVDFGYLLAQAKVESGLDSDAKARTSSATGLFQFIESTWLETMHRHGSAHGLGHYADAIETTRSGARVFDPVARAAILDLRRDPQISSLMAAALADDNRAALKPILGREPDASELYMAHFLGSGGARKFLSALQENPDQSAAALLPRPAAANRSIFYSGGASRSVADVMDLMRGKIERALPSEGLEGSPTQTPSARPVRLNPAESFAALQANSSARISYQTVSPSDMVASARPNAPRIPMSDVLMQGFAPDAGGDVSRARTHAHDAYVKLKAAGL